MARIDVPRSSGTSDPVEYPRTFNINAFGPIKSQLYWGSLSAQNSGRWFGGARQTTNGSLTGKYLEFEFYAAAGIYNIRFFFRVDPQNGIADISIDGAAIGSLDMYGAAGASSQVEWTNITIPTDGNHTMRLQIDTKNPSNVTTNYSGEISWITGHRTAPLA